MPRKIIQIAAAEAMTSSQCESGTEIDYTRDEWSDLYALCDDGTVWSMDLMKKEKTWEALPLIPQDSEGGASVACPLAEERAKSALATLAEFARTAPGRLPDRVQLAIRVADESGGEAWK